MPRPKLTRPLTEEQQKQLEEVLPKLKRFANAIATSPQDRDDVLSAVYLSAVESIPAWDPDKGSLFYYLSKCAWKQITADRKFSMYPLSLPVRENDREDLFAAEPPHDRTSKEFVENVPARQVPPEIIARDREFFNQWFQKLTQKQREAAELYFLKGLTLSQICGNKNITREAIRQRLDKASAVVGLKFTDLAHHGVENKGVREMASRGRKRGSRKVTCAACWETMIVVPGETKECLRCGTEYSKREVWALIKQADEEK